MMIKETSNAFSELLYEMKDTLFNLNIKTKTKNSQEYNYKNARVDQQAIKTRNPTMKLEKVGDVKC